MRNAKDIGPKLSMDLRGRGGDGQNERTLARNVLKFNVTGSVKRLLEEEKRGERGNVSERKMNDKRAHVKF